jgi:ABC-2 type transport system permease protein
MPTGYLMLEARRSLRNPRTLIFTFVFPVALFLLYCGLYGDQRIGGGSQTTLKAYLMGSMAAYGAFMVAVTIGGRTALERSNGWQRQLRLTPLSPVGYLVSKATVAMALAIVPVVLVSLVGGLAEDVSLSATGWAQVVGGVWLATVPFAVLGLLIGQVATADSLQPIIMTVMLLLAFVGGVFIPIQIFPDWLQHVAQVLPTYWMAEIGHGPFTGNTETGTAIVVLAAYTVVLGFAVIRRYRRDSARV